MDKHDRELRVVGGEDELVRVVRSSGDGYAAGAGERVVRAALSSQLALQGGGRIVASENLPHEPWELQRLARLLCGHRLPRSRPLEVSRWGVGHLFLPFTLAGVPIGQQPTCSTHRA